jgi:hypothetical protein
MRPCFIFFLLLKIQYGQASPTFDYSEMTHDIVGLPENENTMLPKISIATDVIHPFAERMSSSSQMIAGGPDRGRQQLYHSQD